MQRGRNSTVSGIYIKQNEFLGTALNQIPVKLFYS